MFFQKGFLILDQTWVKLVACGSHWVLNFDRLGADGWSVSVGLLTENLYWGYNVENVL